MTVARRLVVDPSVSGWYHCINRCVRRAYLCGGRFEHRAIWIRSHLIELSTIFAVDIASYAVMSNHLHLVLNVSPVRAERWSSEEIARRWLRLFRNRRTMTADSGHAEAYRLSADRDQIQILRTRLSDLSWFMRCLSEPIARRANREDACTGRFWEGRFKCRCLLDEGALVACCVYTDLNPIRAGLARTPESSNYTSVQDRIHVRQLYEKVKGLRQRAPRRAAQLLVRQTARIPRHPQDGIWLAPMTEQPYDESDAATVGLELDAYLSLVDGTGRNVRSGRPGAIPHKLQPILDRLAIDANRWSRVMIDQDSRFGTAVGKQPHIVREAARRGRRWIIRGCDVFAAAAPIDPPASR